MRPAPDLLARLAMPFFCAVPSTAGPASPTSVIPGAGPYSVASSDLAGTTVLTRNPNYKGGAHTPTTDRATGEPGPGTTIDRVGSGAVGYAVGIRPDQYATFPRPDARLFVNPSLGIRYLRFNVTRPLFGTANARKSVALALDRTRLASRPGRRPVADRPDPPAGDARIRRSRTLPARPPTAAQLDAAHALLGPGFAATADFYVATIPSTSRSERTSRPSGAARDPVVVHPVPFAVLNSLQASDAWDLSVGGWIADYDDPNALMNPLVGPGGTQNVGGFDDPVLSPAMTAAAALTGSSRTAAYADLDLRLSGEALRSRRSQRSTTGTSSHSGSAARPTCRRSGWTSLLSARFRSGLRGGLPFGRPPPQARCPEPSRCWNQADVGRLALSHRGC